MIFTPLVTDVVISVEYNDGIETGLDISGRFPEPIEFDAGSFCGLGRAIEVDVSNDDDEERSTFEELAKEWKRSRSRGVDLEEMVMNSAYQRIIGMGKSAIPFLLDRLAEKPDHWFWALFAISGDNPVPPDHEGKLSLMAESWLAWGRDRGYLT